MQKSKSKFISVYATSKLTEVAIIKSILDAENIEYFITNENFARICGYANGACLMDIMVEREKAREAEELLKDFISPNRNKK